MTVVVGLFAVVGGAILLFNLRSLRICCFVGIVGVIFCNVGFDSILTLPKFFQRSRSERS